MIFPLDISFVVRFQELWGDVWFFRIVQAQQHRGSTSLQMSLLALLPSRLVASAGIWDTRHFSMAICFFLSGVFSFWENPHQIVSARSHVLRKDANCYLHLPPLRGGTYQALPGNHSLVTKGTIHLLNILPIWVFAGGIMDYCAPNSSRIAAVWRDALETSSSEWD